MRASLRARSPASLLFLLRLPAHDLLGGARNVRRGQLIGIRKLFGIARCAEHILNADEFDGPRARLRQHFGHSAAEAAENVVILRRDEGAGLLGAARSEERR